MKLKVSIVFILISLILLSTIQPKQNTVQSQFQMIPDDAIRLRILANSDSDEDQALKHLIRDKVSDEISQWVAQIDNIEEARQLIEININNVEEIVSDILQEEKSTQLVDVQYNSNVTFPAKIYDNYVYPAGEYEAVLITLGEGKGANWWCVLFPPLCFLDFDNGTIVAEANEVEKVKEDEEVVKVKFFLFEWLGWS